MTPSELELASGEDRLTNATPAADLPSFEAGKSPAAASWFSGEERHSRLINISQDIIWEIAIEGLPELLERIRRGEGEFEELVDLNDPDFEFRRLFVSPAVEQILGLTPEEVIARPFEEGLTPASLELVYRLLGEQVEKEAAGTLAGPFKLELEEIHRNGSIIITEVLAEPIRDDQGTPVGLAGTSRDVTERRRAEQALRNREEQFRHLVETTSEWIWEMDLGYRFIYSNPRVRSILGYSPEELSEIGLLDLFHPESRKELEQRIPEHVASKTGWSGWIVRVAHKAGGYRYLESNANPILGDAGEVVGFRGSDRDITEIRQAERRIAESEKWFRTIFECEPECVKVLDENGALKDMNPAGLRMIEADTIEESRGMPVLSLVAPEYREKVRKSLDVVFRGESCALEFEIVGLKGTRRWMDSIQVPLPDAKGNVVAAIAVTRDMTERKRADRELRESEGRFRQLAENLEQVFWLANRGESEDIEYISPAYEKVWGRSCDSLYAERNHFIKSVHPDDRAKVECARARQDGGESTDEVYRIVRPDGTIRWIRDRAFPVRDSTGQVCRIAGIADDITEMKAAEEALHESERELRESLHEKETLLREVHHRVKNNLQIVSSLLHFQARKLADPSAVEIVRDGQRRLHAMMLVHDQLYQAKHLAHIEFDQYIHRLAEEMRNSHGETAAQLDFNVQVDPVALPIETALPLGMIINELVTNSLKHAFREGGRGRLEVCLRKSQGQLSATVIDDGRGLPANVDPDQPATFGLQLVKNLARQIDAKVTLNSKMALMRS